MMQIRIATKNIGKLREFSTFFQGTTIELVAIHELRDDYVIEDGLSFRANAIKKAESVSRLLNEPSLADDSGLCIRALHNYPGVYSARFAGHKTDYSIKNDLIIRTMKYKKDRRAAYVCALAFACPGKPTVVFESEWEGTISETPLGENGFGYDPIFYLPMERKSAAELTLDYKNKISHRAQAAQLFLKWYQEQSL
jgi:XTP/dITP diphosphohydrolase